MLAPLAHPACLLQLMHVMELRRNNEAHKLVYMRGTERKETTLTPSARK